MSDAENRLPSWVRDVDLEPGASRIDAIRGAATDLAKSNGDTEILDLVLLAHGRPSRDALLSVAAALREHDESSAVREGDLLASITAAAAAAFANGGRRRDRRPVRPSRLLGTLHWTAARRAGARRARTRRSRARILTTTIYLMLPEISEPD